MKEVRICYSDKANIGDAINPFIVKNVLGHEPVLTDVYHCQITGIGSGLRRVFANPGGIRNRFELHRKKVKYSEPLIIWSAGFITTPNLHEFVIRKDIKVASVRGELSKKYVEQLLHEPVDCTTGDGGLLCSLWIPAESGKKYRLGIIPHFREKGEARFDEIRKAVRDSVLIDVEDDPVKNLKIISSCECVISSSLHGLIIADSYNIPNTHVILTDKLAGDGFKFRDYYSSFGLEDNPLDLNKYSEIDVNDIISRYSVSENMIKKKQEEITAAFQKYL